jgi:hypothetical protein
MHVDGLEWVAAGGAIIAPVCGVVRYWFMLRVFERIEQRGGRVDDMCRLVEAFEPGPWNPERLRFRRRSRTSK